MRGFNKQLYIKFLLIVISEGIAVRLTNIFSESVYPLQYSTWAYILLGALLSTILVTSYDYIAYKRKCKIKRELQEIADAALVRYRVNEANNRT